MAVEKSIEEEISDVINVDDIRRKGDYVREKVLDMSEVDINKTAPSVYNYHMSHNSLGLNEISNVDMGYAGTSVDFAGEHLSKRNPYLKELEYNVGLMNDSKNAIVFLNGGLFTYIPKTQKGNLLSYQDQIAYFYSLFKDLADQGKIVAMVRGTEEHRILKNHKVDMMGILQEALGLDRKTCNDALVNIELEDDIVGNANVGIRTINWNNSATTGAYIGRKMEERATKRGGADIYIARTTMNYFKTAVVGESGDSHIQKRPIYLVSSGSYTPFKGAMTAGAEYNSIKDGELPPCSFWYKVTVEENNPNFDDDRNYIVRVNPIQYTAHQTKLQGTDELVAGIENSIEEATDGLLQSVVDKYSERITTPREEGRKRLRDILIGNKQTAKENAKISEFIAYKKGKCTPKDAHSKSHIQDLGCNVPKQTPNTIILGQDDDMQLEK